MTRLEHPDDVLQQQLQEYLDGQMTSRQAKEFSKRLEGDGELREQERLYRSLQQALQAEPADIAEFDYAVQRMDIMAAVERKVLLETVRRRRVIPLVPFGAALAAAAALVLAVLPAIHSQGPSPVPSKQAVVATAVLRPAAAEPAGKAEMEVSFSRLRPAEVQISNEPIRLAPAVPAGTVIAAVGPHQRDASSMYTGLMD